MLPEASNADMACEWMKFARSNLALAEAKRPEGVLWDTLAFHAQQAAEKAFKAVLSRRGLDFPLTHNLAVLRDLLPSDIDLPRKVAEATALSVYVVASRYPQDMDGVNEGEYREALDQAAAVVKWAASIVETKRP